MSSPVALIFGVGKNVGASVAKSFASKGYKVAVASRSFKHQLPSEGFLEVSCDLADPSSVTKVFKAVEQRLGHPSVVVYNAASHIGAAEKDHPLGIQLNDFLATMEINVTSAFAAAQNAVASFAALPESTPKTFIYTGNRLNIAPIPPLFAAGMGKAAAAHMMAYLSEVYAPKGYRFYYADERDPDGSPVYMRIDGPAAGKFYVELAQHQSEVPWLATFVKGEGYKDFQEIKYNPKM